MSSKERSSDTGIKAQNKAKKAYEEAILRAYRAYVETKEQADAVHKKALKQADNECAREEADIKYQEALEQARKVRDEMMDEAQKALNDARE